MPYIKRSPRLSSVLTAANAALSSIYSSSTPVTTSSPVAASVVVAQSAIVTTSTSSLVDPFLTLASSTVVPTSTSSVVDPIIAQSAYSPDILSTKVTKKTTYAGVNLSGLDFSCDKNGACKVNGVAVPNTGAAQMQHLTSEDHLNIYRLTVSWQYLTNNVVGGVLNATNFGTYDNLMQSCLSTGAKCVVDVHNYVSPDPYKLSKDAIVSSISYSDIS